MALHARQSRRLSVSKCVAYEFEQSDHEEGGLIWGLGGVNLDSFDRSVLRVRVECTSWVPLNTRVGLTRTSHGILKNTESRRLSVSE